MLEAVNVFSGYGKLAIIQDISFKVNSGDLVAIVGPNGSGKSTLVKTVMGLTKVFEGKILFEGVDITKSSPEKIAKMKLGFVPQVANVFSDLTVSDNLTLGGITARERKADLRERVTGLFPILRERARQKAGLLSGGERQMLAVGRALMAAPRLLILDEPTAALAPMVADQLFKSLVQIREELGVTLILVEQNARKALSLANKGIVLVQGKNVFEGTPDQISQDKDIISLFLGELSI
ncbi:MAG: ABC transporter ATP-binding protein [Thaumarchaeota archaeon]|nr:ABC transporter ATP-binding protein [Nitrososphaerota archaeon]